MTGCADYLRFMSVSASYLPACGLRAAADDGWLRHPWSVIRPRADHKIRSLLCRADGPAPSAHHRKFTSRVMVSSQ